MLCLYDVLVANEDGVYHDMEGWVGVWLRASGCNVLQASPSSTEDEVLVCCTQVVLTNIVSCSSVRLTSRLHSPRGICCRFKQVEQKPYGRSWHDTISTDIVFLVID